MLFIENNKIQLTRGDTAYFVINIINDDTQEPYTLSENDILKFTVDYKPNHNHPVIQKIAAEDGIITITPEDTNSLSTRKYVYDVELTTGDGDVFTIIPPSVFEICGEVTI